MQLSKEEFQFIEKYITTEGKNIYNKIKAKYEKYLISEDKKQALNQNNGRVIVHQYDISEIEAFGGIDKVPPGHSGRRKKDNIIHVYPYSQQLSFITDLETLIQVLINDIVIHEIFHFYIQPDQYDVSETEYGDDVLFGHRLTEGIVQYFTNKYIQENNLALSHSTYIEEVLLVETIVQDFIEQGKTEEEIMMILLNDNQTEMINKCTNGEQIKTTFIAKTKLHQRIKIFLKNVLTDLNNSIEQQKIFHKYTIMTDIDVLYSSIIEEFSDYKNEIEEYFYEYNNTKKVL